MATARATSSTIVALRFDGTTLWAIDQTALPWRERELELRTADDVAGAIRRLAIRGAPLIGVAAAYGVALELARDFAPDTLDKAVAVLRAARPTAVNLAYGVDRVARAAREATANPAAAALTSSRVKIVVLHCCPSSRAASSGV